MAGRNQMAGGCLTVFGLPFFAVGVFMIALIVRTFNEARDMRTWPVVPATVLATDLESHRDSDGDVTQRVTARYRYEVAGQVYEGTRVGLHGGSDNLGQYHAQWHERLQASLQAETPLPAHVNPLDPNQAVLDPTPRTGMMLFQAMFGVVFGGAGAGLMIFGLRSGRGGRLLRQARLEHPAEPWMWRPDWANRQATPSSGSGAWGLAFMAVFWNLISWPMVVLFLPKLIEERNVVGFFFLLFPLIGIFLAVAAVKSVRSWRRFRRAEFHFRAVPIQLGGELVAGLRLPERLQPRNGLSLTLRCLRKEVRGSGKHRRVTEVPLWEETQVVPAQSSRDPTSSLWPVHFHVPYDQPPSDAEPSGHDVLWRLQATAQVDGPDLDLTFEIPVFGRVAAPPPAAEPVVAALPP